MSHIGHGNRLDAVCAMPTLDCLFVADKTDKGVQCALRFLIKNHSKSTQVNSINGTFGNTEIPQFDGTQYSVSKSASKKEKRMVPEAGLEPARYC